MDLRRKRDGFYRRAAGIGTSYLGVSRGCCRFLYPVHHDYGWSRSLVSDFGNLSHYRNRDVRRDVVFT